MDQPKGECSELEPDRPFRRRSAVTAIWPRKQDPTVMAHSPSPHARWLLRPRRPRRRRRRRSCAGSSTLCPRWPMRSPSSGRRALSLFAAMRLFCLPEASLQNYHIIFSCSQSRFIWCCLKRILQSPKCSCFCVLLTESSQIDCLRLIRRFRTIQSCDCISFSLKFAASSRRGS